MKATMKLSEAILLGSVGSEQGYGTAAITSTGPGLCALGAALHACGHLHEGATGAYDTVDELWPWSMSVVSPPVETILYNMMVSDMIVVLNDRCKWTRPQIASWVAELEKIYDPDPAPVLEERGAVCSDSL